MNVAILGASGYIGQNLINKLINETNHKILALSTRAEDIQISHERLDKYNVDVFDTQRLERCLTKCDVVFYLIHMMGQKSADFEKEEILAAESFCKAAKKSNIKRVIYLGGLGNETDKLSKHLLSRHKTGEIIRQNISLSIEFRASMIIGKGSVSYDIISNLVNKFPLLILPKWFQTFTQPIGLIDALTYLISAIDIKLNHSEIVEIGGPEKLSYKALMSRYAKWKRKTVFFITLPIVPFGVATWWLNLFISKKQAKIGIAMVESLANPMLVTNNRAKQLFPTIKPKPLEAVFT